MDSGAQDSPNRQAAGWYARLRAPDCGVKDRASFETWQASGTRNAAAYAAAERMSEALANLAGDNPRLRAMISRAASAGATLPDDPVRDDPGSKSGPAINAEPTAARRSRPASCAPVAWAAGITVVIVGGLILLTMEGPEPAGTNSASSGGPATRYSSSTSRRAVTDDGARAYLDVASTRQERCDTT